MRNENETIDEVVADFSKPCWNDHQRRMKFTNAEIDVWNAEYAKRMIAALKRERAKRDADLENWKRQALEENAALDVARDECAKLRKALGEVLDALQYDPEYSSCPAYVLETDDYNDEWQKLADGEEAPNA